MIDGNALKAAVPHHTVEVELVLHPLELAERTRTVQWLDDAAGDGEPFRVALTVSSDDVITAHGILDTVGLNISGRRQDRRRRHAVGFHNPHPIGVVTLLPAVAFLQTAAGQRTEMMMNIKNFHAAS